MLETFRPSLLVWHDCVQPKDQTTRMLTAAHGVGGMLRVAYHMLKDGTFYQDLGPSYRRLRNPGRAATSLANLIRALGYQVDIRPAGWFSRLSGEESKFHLR